MTATGTWWPWQGGELCRDAYLLTRRTAFGWHSFTRISDELERCCGCHVVVPVWAVDEGLGHHFGLTPICPGFLTALTVTTCTTTGPEPPEHNGQLLLV